MKWVWKEVVSLGVSSPEGTFFLLFPQVPWHKQTYDPTYYWEGLDPNAWWLDM